MNKMKYSMILSLMFFAFYATARSGNASAAGEVIVLNKADFLAKVFNYEKNASEWKYEGDKPCIIDFYADWCGPCRRVAPVLKDLAKRYKDDIVIYKVNVDKERDLAGTFGVSSIPTIIFVPMKGEPQVSMGALPEESIVKMIEEVLLEKKQ